MNKRKVQHTKLEIVIMITDLTIFTFGITNVIYHLMFNNPTITFGGF